MLEKNNVKPMIIFLQHPFDLKKLEVIKNQKIITFDHESHKILCQKNIQHTQSEDFLSKEDFDSIEKTCYKWTKWFNEDKIEKEIKFQGINIGSLFQWEFHFYLVPIIKKIFEIGKISREKSNLKCSCSPSLRNIAKMYFKHTELFDEIQAKNSFLFDNVKWNITNNLEINIKKENFQKIKDYSQKILLNFSKLKDKENTEKKSILFVEFNPIKYESLFLKMKNSEIRPVFFNYRRPYFWDLNSFNIINQTEGEIITNKITQKNNTNEIREKIFESLKNYNFDKYFSINGSSFWNIIKNDFLRIFDEKIQEAMKVIEIAMQIFENKDIKEIIIWSESGFTEQIIMELGKKNNIPINLIQHGIIVDEDNERNLEFNKFSGIVPSNSNRFLVWNKSTKNYAEQIGFSNNDIITIGNANFENLVLKDEKYLEEDYVLLATTAPIKNQHAGYNSKLLDKYESEILTICEKIKKLNKKLVVRPHPFPREFEIDKIVEEAFPDAIIDKKTNILTLIKNAGVVISFGISTIIFEAQFLHKATFFIKSDHDMFGIPKYLEKNPELMIKLDDIELCVSKSFDDNVYRNSIIEMNSKIMSDEFFNIGQSTDSFLKFYE